MQKIFSTLLCLSVACSDSVPAPAPRVGPVDSGVAPEPPVVPSFEQTDAAGTTDAMGCSRLNIGILGMSGSEPASNFQQWLIDAGTSAKRILLMPGEPFTSATLMPFDVVIFDRLVRDYAPTEAAVFKSWIEAGGSAMSMSGHTGTASDFRANVFLDTIGVSYAGSLLNGPVSKFEAHPVTLGLTSVSFVGGFSVQAAGASPNVRTSVASLAPASVGYAVEAGTGRAFVWGDEWIEFDSEWTSMAQIKSFWVNIFKWLRPRNCALMPR
jgi:hypothetical protein